MNKEPNNEYLLVMPDGACKGFNDLESAKAYVNIYYERLIGESVVEDDYNDRSETTSGGDARMNICTELGVEDGKCELYNTDDVIQKIDEELVFDAEKKEVIERLCEAEINFNIYDNNLDLLMADVQPIDIMETYGEMD